MDGELQHEEPTRGREFSRMARTKRRQHGSGCLLRRGRGWAIRWRELEIAPDGTTKRVLRYESLGQVSRTEAGLVLAAKLAEAGNHVPTRSRVTFGTLASQWEVSVLPMYKASTQKHRRFMLKKHLLPRFGETALCDVSRQEIQAYVAHLTKAGYAPKSIDHIHDVLSAVLRTAVKWGHLKENPARGVDLPTLRTVRPKWALTKEQAATLLDALPPLAQALVGLALLTGLRRGELFALRWRDVSDDDSALTVREAVYDGTFGTPKTEAGQRVIPLSATAVRLIQAWREYSGGAEPDRLVFSTRNGTPISPNNVLRRMVAPACKVAGVPRASWLTFRRTYSSWAHEKGVPGKVVAQLMGHTNVDVTLNIYTQVLDGSLRAAVETVGTDLFTIVHKPEKGRLLSC
jgi:integrase